MTMPDYIEEWFPLALLVFVCFSIVFLATYASMENEKRWQTFKVEQNCVLVGVSEGDTFVGVGYATTAGGAGPVVTVSATPNKKGYKCDDGVTYWRNK